MATTALMVHCATELFWPDAVAAIPMSTRQYCVGGTLEQKSASGCALAETAGTRFGAVHEAVTLIEAVALPVLVTKVVN